MTDSETESSAARSTDDAIAGVLRRAGDVTPDARVVFEAIRGPDGSVVDLRIRHGNRAYWQLSGLHGESALNRTLSELVPGLDLGHGLAETLLRAMESGRDVVDRDIATRVQSGPLAGQERHFEVELAVVDDHMAASFRDITDRLAMEEDLHTTLARFEALFEQLPVALILVGADRSVRLNDAAVELFGRDREEIAASAFLESAPWVPPDQLEHVRGIRARIAAGAAAERVPAVIVRPDGERRQLEGSSFTVRTADGRVAGNVSVLLDMTERRALESQLRHGQKMEALGRLAGGIAHDFNNVLMAISGYAELLHAEVAAGQASVELTEHLLESTRRAVELTARLTAFARKEASRREPTDVAAAIRSILPLIRRLAPETIEVLTELQPGRLVLIDRSEFEQAIVNLVVNAVDAMPGGGRLVIESCDVELEEETSATHIGHRSGPHHAVSVSDTGEGMDEVTRRRMFEPFFTTKGVGEGSGLGLAMVFATVERAGGTISVYSEPGHGTAIKLYFPPTDDALREAPPDRSPAATGGTERILLVEDDDGVRELVARVLGAAGYDVSVATRPSEALALAETHRFDLLMSDVVMPEMTGDEVARRLRALQPELPVVFMSGYSERSLGFALGPADAMLQKPLSTREIRRVVRASLDATAAQSRS